MSLFPGQFPTNVKRKPLSVLAREQEAKAQEERDFQTLMASQTVNPPNSDISLQFEGVTPDELSQFGTSVEELTTELSAKEIEERDFQRLMQQQQSGNLTPEEQEERDFQALISQQQQPQLEETPEEIPYDVVSESLPNFGVRGGSELALTGLDPLLSAQTKNVTPPKDGVETLGGMLNLGQKASDNLSALVRGAGSSVEALTEISDYVFGTGFHDKYTDVFDYLFPIQNKEDFDVQVSSGLGQIGSLVTGGMALKAVGKLIGMGHKGQQILHASGMLTAGGTMGAAEGIRANKEADAEELETSAIARWMNIAAHTGIGMTDAVPVGRLIKRFHNKKLMAPITKMLDTIENEKTRNTIAYGVVTAIEEGGQEVLSSGSMSKSAEFWLGLDRDVRDDMLNAGAVGFTTGLIYGAITGRRAFVHDIHSRAEKESSIDIQGFAEWERTQAIEENKEVFEMVDKALREFKVPIYENFPSESVIKPTKDRTYLNILPELKPKLRTAGDEIHMQIAEFGEQTLEEKQITDIYPQTRYAVSPDIALRDDPARLDLAEQMLNARLFQRYRTDTKNYFLDDLQTSLSTKEQKMVRRIIEAGFDKPEVYRRFREMYPDSKLGSVASDVDTMMRYDYKPRILHHKLQEFQEFATPQELAGFKRVLAGASIQEAVEGLDMTPEYLSDILEDVSKIQSWGYQDFVTFIERGSYALSHEIELEDGSTATRHVAFAINKAQAKQRAKEFLAENPDVKTLTLDYNRRFNPDINTAFSTKQTKMIENQILKNLEFDAEELNEHLADFLKEHGVFEGAIRGVIKPKGVRKPVAGPLLQRKDILEGEENYFEALRSYVYQIEKYLATYLPAIRVQRFLAANPSIPGQTENRNQVLQDQLDYMLGKRQVSDDVIDGLFDWAEHKTEDVVERVTGKRPAIGGRSHRASRAVSTIRQMNAVLKIGYRQSATGVNIIGSLINTWVGTGTKYTVRGALFTRSSEGKKLLLQEAPYLAVDSGIDTSGRIQSVRSPLDFFLKPLGSFQGVEGPVRSIAYGASYLMAKEKFQMDDKAARAFARKFIRNTQFIYDTLAVAHMFRSNTGRLVGQFRTYMAKQIELFALQTPQERAKYLTALAVIGGPQAVIRMAMAIPIIGLLLNEPLEWVRRWLAETFPTASRGLVGATTGTDITGQLTPQFVPYNLEQALGVTVSSIVDAYTSVIKPVSDIGFDENGDIANIPQAYESARQFGRRQAIFLDNLMKVYEAAETDGWLVDPDGQNSIELTSRWDALKIGLGAPPIHTAEQRQRAREQTEKNRMIREELEATGTFMARKINLGGEFDTKGFLSGYMAGRYGATGGTSKGLKQRVDSAKMSLAERILQQSPKVKKGETATNLFGPRVQQDTSNGQNAR